MYRVWISICRQKEIRPYLWKRIARNNNSPSPKCELSFSSSSNGRRTAARGFERKVENGSHPESQDLRKIARSRLRARRFSTRRARMDRRGRGGAESRIGGRGDRDH